MSKRKGSNAERELIHQFWATPDWAAIRVAGSGSMTYPAPDILASKNKTQLAIECKATSAKSQYLTKKEVYELLTFSERSGASPLVAVRFARAPWVFLHPHHLKETDKHYVVNQDLARERGMSFEEITKD